ncbi:putative secreted effector protein [Blumeria graminis f. sp. tritici 96224]|nr:putative secreted effector protein [Blumeria graminis f. sp. tritici 96224]
MFSGTIVSPRHRIEALSTQQIVDKADSEKFDCNGQIFGGNFISVNKEKAKNAYYSRSDRRLKQYRFPSPIEKEFANIPSRAWMWPLRIPETSQRKSKSTTSYQLIFGEDHEFLGVYHFSGTTYVRCSNGNNPEYQRGRGSRFPIDLNISAEEDHSSPNTD